MIDRERAKKLGDRHLRLGPTGLFLPNIESRVPVVRVTIAPKLATTTAGQQMVWMLTNLLSRQYGVVQELELAVPAVPLLASVAPFGARRSLLATLLETAALVAGPTLLVRPASGTYMPGTIEILVGRQEPGRGVGSAVGILGSGWNAFVGAPALVPDVLPTDTNPLGPYLAACLGAGEVFKRQLGLREGKGRYAEAEYLSLWDFCQAPSWDKLPKAPWPRILELPPFYLVGTGAVGQALLSALLACGSIRGYMTVIDHDPIDDTNLNRYPLATLADIDRPKVDLTMERAQGSGLTIYPYNCKLEDYVYDTQKPAQRPDVQELERDYRYALIVSCVDKNSARHAIQRLWPKVLFGGSTNGLGVEAGRYDMLSSGECLMCSNPIFNANFRTIEEVRKDLLCLSPEERHRWATENGLVPESVKAYLADPKCGTLGEAEIARFLQTGGKPDWSVGFVSLAAGVILAARLIRNVSNGIEVTPELSGHCVRMSFLNPGLRVTKHSRRQGCECVTAGAQAYTTLWR